MPKCKVTVIRREFFPDLAEKYLADPNTGKCSRFEDGQEFIFERDHQLKGGFCTEAWSAINRYVFTHLYGGTIMPGWTKDDKVMISCCNDGVRPVIFKIERIDD